MHMGRRTDAIKGAKQMAYLQQCVKQHHQREDSYLAHAKGEFSIARNGKLEYNGSGFKVMHGSLPRQQNPMHPSIASHTLSGVRRQHK